MTGKCKYAGLVVGPDNYNLRLWRSAIALGRPAVSVLAPPGAGVSYLAVRADLPAIEARRDPCDWLPTECASIDELWPASKVTQVYGLTDGLAYHEINSAGTAHTDVDLARAERYR